MKTEKKSIPKGYFGILEANTYYWSPATHADGRRSRERRRVAEAERTLESLGFGVSSDSNSVTGVAEFEGEEIEVVFSYSESCRNVYKSLQVYRDGRRSNITLLRKMAGVPSYLRELQQKVKKVRAINE